MTHRGWRLERRMDGTYQAVRVRVPGAAEPGRSVPRCESAHTVRERHALASRTHEGALREFNSFLRTETFR